MSYEGYEVWLCANGHRHFFDCHDTPDEKTWACFCRASRAWSRSVDDTNGPGDEPALTVAQQATYSTCPCCGLSKQTSPEAYVIPSEKQP